MSPSLSLQPKDLLFLQWRRLTEYTHSHTTRINVISFMPVQTAHPAPIFIKFINPPNVLRLEPLCLILSYLNKCRKWQFSGNSQSVNQSISSCTKLYLHQTKNAENASKISFMPWNKVHFWMHILSQTHNGSMTLHGDVLYQISPTSIKECVKYGGKFTYGLKQNMTLSLFSWNSSLLDNLLQRTHFPQFYDNPWNN